MDYFDSILWEKAMQLTERVVAVSRLLPRDQRFGLRNQMTRAATSIPSNIAEGWVRESWREKVNFLAIAHGSLAELHTQLLVCIRVRWLCVDDIRAALALIDEIGRMLTALKAKWRRMPVQRPVARPTTT
jgi:four helix bundle protein